jgi:hypothetical protein
MAGCQRFELTHGHRYDVLELREGRKDMKMKSTPGIGA